VINTNLPPILRRFQVMAIWVYMWFAEMEIPI